jgi:Kef-type K+ transport system membrane component KefB
LLLGANQHSAGELAEQASVGDGLFAAIICLVLAAGWFTDYIGIYSVFGGFIAGMALPRTPGFSTLLNGRTLQVTRCFLLPVFFAYSGLNTDLTTSFGPTTLLVLGVLLVAAFVSKALASMVVLKAFRWSWGESVAMSGLLNARGLIILIYINIGLALGLIETRLFSILVLVAIVTTAAAMPVYRLHFNDEREEAARRESKSVGDPQPERSRAPVS